MAVTKKRWSNATWRVWLVVAGMGFGALVITLRLAQLQIIDHDEYAREARLTHISEITLNDRRGALLDRSGYPLAASQTAYNVMVERDDWADPAEAAAAAQQLAEATGVSAQQMLDIVATVDVFEVPVAKGIDYAKAVAVRDLGLPGVRLLEAPQRVYPAARALGPTPEQSGASKPLRLRHDPQCGASQRRIESGGSIPRIGISSRGVGSYRNRCAWNSHAGHCRRERTRRGTDGIGAGSRHRMRPPGQ